MSVAELAREVGELREGLDEVLLTLGMEGRRRHSAAMLRFAREQGLDPNELLVPEPDPSRLISVEEAARMLGLSLEQTRRHLRAGRIFGFSRRGRSGWLVSRASAEEFASVRPATDVRDRDSSLEQAW